MIPGPPNNPQLGPQMIPLKIRNGVEFQSWEGESTTKKSKQKNFFLISEIKPFKSPTLQWHRRQK